jgi:ABC-type nitrate/sulfonate/bicarbonate transport system permease component
MLVRYQPNTTTTTPEQVYQIVNNLFRHIYAASQLVSHAQSSIKNMIYGLVKGLILINNKSGSFQVPTIRRV